MEETIENLVDYVKYIQELDKEYVLSRGQGQDKALLPSVFRLDDCNMRLFSNTTAKEFIEEFKNNSVLYLDNHTRNIDNEFEWIILAQHFGVPTCLLDFTYSHMVSLMFALEKALDDSALAELKKSKSLRIHWTLKRNKEIIKELFDIGFGLYEKGAKCNYQQGAENAFMYGYLLGVQSQKANS